MSKTAAKREAGEEGGAEDGEDRRAKTAAKTAAKKAAVATAAVEPKAVRTAAAGRCPAGEPNMIAVRGAREHNLQDVDIDLPRDQLVVLTGLSGSGKSSLAFDTIYAEGQRRYVESLSSYARQFLGQMDKPDVDFIEGLSPAISIDQKSASRNPRSTVGTITEIYDYLRLLYARIGIPHCPKCGRVITRQTPQQIVDRVLQLPEGTRFQVLAPVVRGRKGEYEGMLAELAKQGFTRARIDGEIVELVGPHEERPRPLREPHDRGRRGPARAPGRHRAPAHRLARDRAAARRRRGRGRDRPEGRTTAPSPRSSRSPSTSRARYDGLSFDELAPRNFSFNSPYGACERCDGLGTRFEVDPELIVGDDDLSIREGAIAPWSGYRGEYFNRVLDAVGDEYKFSVDDAVEEADQGAAEGRAVRRGQDAGARPVQEPVRAQARVHAPGTRA